MRESLSYYETKESRPVSIISIPTDLGSDARGCSEAPAYLYSHGLEEMLIQSGAEYSHTSIECPTAPNIRSVKNFDAIHTITARSAEVVESAIRGGDMALLLGGDHSAALGGIRGAAKALKQLGVIYIDAHPDVNTEETTITQNIHGMVAALALEHVEPQNFLHLGVKDFDQAEIDFIRNESLSPITMMDIVRHGMGIAFDAIDSLAKKVNTVWVSMDMDAIDEQFAPGVAMPNEAGFTKREILNLAQYIGHAFPIAGVDIVEILPRNDRDGKTAKLAIELIAQCMGSEFGSYNEYISRYEAHKIAV